MATIKEVQERLHRLITGFEQAATDVIQQNEDIFPRYIRDQLYSGLDGNEKELRPNYLNDPYFRTKYGSQGLYMAKQYASWKEGITPPMQSQLLGFRPRPYKVPNLFIDGTFHRSIDTTYIQGGVRIGSAGCTFASDIEQKYHESIYAVSRTARKHFLKYYFKPFMRKYWHGMS